MSSPHYPQCAGCKQPLAPPRKKWCSDTCAERHRPKRDRTGQRDYHKPRTGDRHKGQRTKPPGRFVGVDGESVDGKYILLAAASDDGWSVSVESRTQLSTRECLTFISNLPARAKCWGFAFGYDVNMMLGDMPVERVTYLYEHGHVYWKEFRVAYVPGKKLTVTRYHGAYKGAPKVASATVWDAFIWMQSSFVDWLESWSLAPDKEIARIRAMKKKRSTFTADERVAIKKYCLSECQYLAAGARRLVTLISDAGIKTNTYYSPATISKALLKREHVMEHRADVPDEIAGAVDAAYYGGRAEVAVIGPVDGPLYQYDIRSAYPAASVTLPCLACASWEHNPGGGTNVTPWSLCRVSWRPKRGHTSPQWGPLPVRPRTGSLRWPTHGTGWYWGVEVLAALRHAHIEVKDVWTLNPHCHHEPFAYLRDLYEQRAELKRNGDPTEFVLKLALNATYGALAEHPHMNNKAPKYRCLAWAGWITAATRAKLLDVLTDDVVLMATDSVISRVPLDVTLGTKLGEWELETYDEMWLAGTGIYYGKRDGEWSKHKTRGFESGQLSRSVLEELWESDGRVGKVRLSRQRFIGMGTALHRVHGFYPPYKRLWRQFIYEPCDKSLDLAPRRTWLTDDVHDGRTVAPSLASHKELERQDRERLVRLYERFADIERRIKLAQSREPNKLRRARIERLQAELLLCAASIDSAEHGLTTVWNDADDPSV